MAIKFIKRPLPKVLHQNILREFTVRSLYAGPGEVLQLSLVGGKEGRRAGGQAGAG